MGILKVLMLPMAGSGAYILRKWMIWSRVKKRIKSQETGLPAGVGIKTFRNPKFKEPNSNKGIEK